MSKHPDQTVVITGTGCVLPGCDSPDQLWQRLLDMQTAITNYRSTHVVAEFVSHFGHITPEQHAAASEVVPFKLRRYAAPCSQWGVKAARDALGQADLDLKQIPEERCGVFTAQGDHTFPSTPSFAKGLTRAVETNDMTLEYLTEQFLEHRGMDPFMAIKCLANNMLAIASLTFGTRGDCGAFVQSENATIAALQSAVFSLRHGYSDMALLICGGSYDEALTLTELHRMGRLSSGGVDVGLPRSFDARRGGTVPSEGAIAFVLETATNARRRGARILAEVSGLANLVEAPPPRGRVDGYRRCADKALASGGLSRACIDAIVANGTGVHDEDAHEANMLIALQDGLAEAIPVTCTTPITGEVPACPTQWLSALGMLQHGLVPPIAQLENPLGDGVLHLVHGASLKRPCRHVLAVNACFAGYHSAVAFSLSLD